MQLINGRIKLVLARKHCLEWWAKAMKVNLSEDPHLLFKWASKALKYLGLVLFAFAIALILSGVFGVDIIAKIILSPKVWEWLLRIAALVFCSFLIAIVYESSK